MWYDVVCIMVLSLPMCRRTSKWIQACQRGLDEDFEVVRKLRMLHGGRHGYCSASCTIPIYTYVFIYIYTYLYSILYPMCVFRANRPWMTIVTHTLPRGFCCEDWLNTRNHHSGKLNPRWPSRYFPPCFQVLPALPFRCIAFILRSCSSVAAALYN